MSRIQTRAILAHICLVGATFKPGQEEEIAAVITPEQVAHLRSTDPPAISGDWTPAVLLQLVPPDEPPAPPADVTPPAAETGGAETPAPPAPDKPTPPTTETEPPAGEPGEEATPPAPPAEGAPASAPAAPAPAPKAKGEKGA